MIRLLLGMLLVLNVVLFLWMQYGNSPVAPPRPEQASKPDFGQIRLVGESETEQAPVIEEEVVAQALEPDAADPRLAEAKSEPAPEPESESKSVSGLEVPTPTQADEPQLQQESSQEQKPEPPAPASPTERQPAVLYCGELGPMRSRNMAEGYRRSLSAGNAEVRVETRPGREIVGYWVMIPQMPDAASAEAMLKRLMRAGFKDLWLMRKGEHKNAISLGLYTQERYAQRHADNIHGKGFNPVVVPKQKKARVYWVLFSDVAAEAMQKVESQKLPANAGMEKKVCDQALTGP
ncbi:SPOR domain-containing protein [Thiolapillus sp.]